VQRTLGMKCQYTHTFT